MTSSYKIIQVTFYLFIYFFRFFHQEPMSCPNTNCNRLECINGRFSIILRSRQPGTGSFSSSSCTQQFSRLTSQLFFSKTANCTRERQNTQMIPLRQSISSVSLSFFSSPSSPPSPPRLHQSTNFNFHICIFAHCFLCSPSPGKLTLGTVKILRFAEIDFLAFSGVTGIG